MPKAKRKSTSPYARGQASHGGKDQDPPIQTGQMDQLQDTGKATASLSGDQFAELVNTIKTSLAGKQIPENEPGICNVVVDDNMVQSVHSLLGSNLSASLKQKIINGEYVELGQILAPQGQKQQEQISVVNGQVVVQQKAVSIRITNIEQWSDAFIVFVSVYTTVHAQKIQGLLKYFHNIRLGAKRCLGLGWKSYDEQFRLKIAQNPQMDWGIIDQELWLLYMYNTNPTSEAINPRSTSAPAVRYLKCYNFNNFETCHRFNCPYLHKCISCNGDHPAVKCTSLNFRVSSDQLRNQPYRARFSTPAHSPRVPGFFPQAYRGSSRGIGRTHGPRFLTNSSK